ncbi:2-oxoacid:acceptor oxidoreductase subunit alpha [Chloroflexota bacterium]
MQGNVACAEGAIAAGCSFMAAYPITPATEVAERLAMRLPEVGGVFIQMEDELSSIASVIGASWGGLKTMTATSGPGMSLMLENIGFGVGSETPCVVVNVQRGGPTTGIPAVEMQGDVVQAKRGSHGEYEIIALAPSSPQEMFDYTIRAFNLAERFRTPVILLSDAFIGHMREEVIIPRPGEVEIVDRVIPEPEFDAETDQGFLNENVAPMPVFGRGFHSHVTSSCHDEYGRRNVTDAKALDSFVKKLRNKILKHRHEITMIDATDAYGDVLLVAYGSVYRCARAASQAARARGWKVGSCKLGTLWPFPAEEVSELTAGRRVVVVMENNMGQLYPYVKAEASRDTEVVFLPPQVLGELHDVEYILESIEEYVR